MVCDSHYPVTSHVAGSIKRLFNESFQSAKIEVSKLTLAESTKTGQAGVAHEVDRELSELEK